MASTDLAALPFVTVRMGQPTALWRVSASGDWTADNALGREYAEALLAHMFANDNPTLLGMVCREITSRGAWTGVEVGFFQHIAQKAVSAR